MRNGFKRCACVLGTQAWRVLRARAVYERR
jgi:hypothetical protein